MKYVWAFLTAVGGTFMVCWLAIAFYEITYREGAADIAAQKVAVDKYYSGYPAPESEIISGKFFSCEAAIQESWRDHTNCFAVLQEMVPSGQHWKIVPEQKRLFQVQNPVGRSSLIYLAERTNGVISLKPVGTSSPPELQIEKPPPQPPKASPKARSTEA